MKCKSLSFSARKRSMMDACQARDESRAELEMAIYINKLCSMCQRAHPVQLPVNSQKADFGEQLSTGLSKTLHESSVHVIVGLTTMFSTHGMIKFFV